MMKGGPSVVSRCYINSINNGKWGLPQRDSPKRRLLGHESSDDDSDDPVMGNRSSRKTDQFPQKCSSPLRYAPKAVVEVTTKDDTGRLRSGHAECYMPPSACAPNSNSLMVSPSTTLNTKNDEKDDGTVTGNNGKVSSLRWTPKPDRVPLDDTWRIPAPGQRNAWVDLKCQSNFDKADKATDAAGWTSCNTAKTNKQAKLSSVLTEKSPLSDAFTVSPCTKAKRAVLANNTAMQTTTKLNAESTEPQQTDIAPTPKELQPSPDSPGKTATRIKKEGRVKAKKTTREVEQECETIPSQAAADQKEALEAPTTAKSPRRRRVDRSKSPTKRQEKATALAPVIHVHDLADNEKESPALTSAHIVVAAASNDLKPISPKKKKSSRRKSVELLAELESSLVQSPGKAAHKVEAPFDAGEGQVDAIQSLQMPMLDGDGKESTVADHYPTQPRSPRSTRKHKSVTSGAAVASPLFTALPTATTVPESEQAAIDSLARKTNRKTIRTMRSLDSDDSKVVSRLDEVIDSVGWATIVIKEKNDGRSEVDTSQAARGSALPSTLAASRTQEQADTSEGKLPTVGLSDLLEDRPLDIVPHIVSLDDDLDAENSVFQPCPMVFLEVPESAPRVESSPTSPRRRRTSPRRRSSRNADRLLACEEFKHSLETTYASPNQLARLSASCEFATPKIKETRRRSIGTVSDPESGDDKPTYKDSKSRASHRRRASLDQRSGDDETTTERTSKKSEALPDTVNSPSGRRSSISSSYGNTTTASPRRRHAAGTKVARRKLHGSGGVATTDEQLAKDEHVHESSASEALRRPGRPANEVVEDEEEGHSEQQLAAASPLRSPLRRRHSSQHWRQSRTEPLSRRSSARDIDAGSLNPLESLTQMHGSELNEQRNAVSSEQTVAEFSVINGADSPEEPVAEVGPADESKGQQHLGDKPTRRRSVSIIHELQAEYKAQEPEPRQAVKDVIPRFSVLRRIAMFSPKAPVESPSKVVPQPHPASPRIASSSRPPVMPRRDFIDAPHSPAGRRSPYAATAAYGSPTPRSPVATVGRRRLAIQPPLTYLTQPPDATCRAPVSPSKTSNASVAAVDITTTPLSYREQQSDAMCRLPPRTMSKSFENSISIKERMAIFQQAATATTSVNKLTTAAATLRKTTGRHESCLYDATKAPSPKHHEDDNSSSVSDMS